MSFKPKFKQLRFYKQFHSKPNSFIGGVQGGIRKETIISDAFDGKSKQNHTLSLYTNNPTYSSRNTQEKSFLNVNVRDSLGSDGSIFDTTERKQNKLKDFFISNQKYESSSNSNMFSINAQNQNIQYNQTNAHGQNTRQQLLRNTYDNNLTPKRETDLTQQQSQLSFIEKQGDYQSTTRENNQWDIFGNSSANKRINFLLEEQFETQTSSIGGYLQGNTAKTMNSIIAGGIGSKNKIQSYFGSNANQREFESNEVKFDNIDDLQKYKRNDLKKNSRSTSYLGDQAQPNLQQENQQFSYYQSSISNTVRPNAQNYGLSASYSISQQKALKKQEVQINKQHNNSESKIKNSNTKIDNKGYKVGADFAKKLRMQKCDDYFEFEQNNDSEQQNYQSISTTKNQDKYKMNQNQNEMNQNKSEIMDDSKKQQSKNNYNSENQVQNKDEKIGKQIKNTAYSKVVQNRNFVEDNLLQSTNSDNKSSFSANIFDSLSLPQEQTNKSQDKKSNQAKEFQQQWDNLNSNKNNLPTEEDKKIQENFEKALIVQTDKIDFKSIKLSRTPLETIDVRQQLASIDQNAKLQAYGELSQIPESSKFDSLTPRSLQNSFKDKISIQNFNQEDSQGNKIKEAETNSKEIAQKSRLNKNSLAFSDNIEQQINEYYSKQRGDQQIERQNNQYEAKIKQIQENKTENICHRQQISKIQGNTFNQSQTEQIQNSCLSKRDSKNEIPNLVNQIKEGQIKTFDEESRVLQQNLFQESKHMIKKEAKTPIQELKALAQELKTPLQEQNMNCQYEKLSYQDQNYKLQLSEQTTSSIEQKIPLTECNYDDSLKKKGRKLSQKLVPNLQLGKNENKDTEAENSAPQLSSRGQVDLSGIVQSIRSIKQGLKEKRNGQNVPKEQLSQNSADILQNDSTQSPSFTKNLPIEFSKQNTENENIKDLKTLKNSIFSNFKTDVRDQDRQQQTQLIEQTQMIEQTQYKNDKIKTDKLITKNTTNIQMEVKEEQQRAKNDFIETQNNNNVNMQFQENKEDQVQLIDMSFNGEKNQYIFTNNIQNQAQQNNIKIVPIIESNSYTEQTTKNTEEEEGAHNIILQQEISIDMIQRFQSLLNNSSNASVKTLPLNYTKEMVNLAYCILQTVRNCSQIPQDQDEYEDQNN